MTVSGFVWSTSRLAGPVLSWWISSHAGGLSKFRFPEFARCCPVNRRFGLDLLQCRWSLILHVSLDRVTPREMWAAWKLINRWLEDALDPRPAGLIVLLVGDGYESISRNYPTGFKSRSWCKIYPVTLSPLRLGPNNTCSRVIRYDQVFLIFA